METKCFILVLLAISSVFVTCDSASGDNLVIGFYQQSCPLAEAIVANETLKQVAANPNLPAKLLRLHAHDCLVRGCDGSIFLNSSNSERTATAQPNLSLGGFEVIDAIKTKVEESCDRIVSCADILALATRDAFALQLSQAQLWDVPTGRRDGNVSLASEALSKLPSPNSNFGALKNNFANNGLNVTDLVALSGAHTVGFSHCSTIRNRLYNFTGVGDTDPSLNSTYAATLKAKCPNIPTDSTTTVEMDPNSSQSFDKNYFDILVQKQGLFTSDAALLNDPQSNGYVQQFRDNNAFINQFKTSMVKMGKVGVLTGTQGQIRKNCNLVFT